PHDWLERKEIFERCERALAEVKAATRGQKCALAVGLVIRNPAPHGRPAQNSLCVLENGEEVFRQAKTLLPTYDVFDEARYFEPAQKVDVWTCDGRRVAFAICEDLWADESIQGQRLYAKPPIDRYRECEADLLISMSASPYQMHKRERRETLHAGVAKSLNVPLVYVNQVGATDEIIFDGASFAVSSSGTLAGRLPVCENAFALVRVSDSGQVQWQGPTPAAVDAPAEIEGLARALVLGIRSYFERTGFKKAIIGLSGGIDSALVATLAAKALGPGNVMGIAMPSQYSSPDSLADAEALAKNLKVSLEVRPIKFIYATLSRELAERRGELAPLSLENLQSRLRGTILMTLANHYGALVLTTGNKSELAMGYSTLYGDMVGALDPIGDLFKLRVYELAKHLNSAWGHPIPERSITREPTAELRPNQKDSDTLPPYEVLDPLLEDYLEGGLSMAELEKTHGSRLAKVGWVKETLRRVELNEYKRRQAAPALKTSPKAFGIGRRVPIAKSWDS
ncbi:MAG: NAD+ synthase, partial [Bacteriovoracia bacterium]